MLEVGPGLCEHRGQAAASVERQEKLHGGVTLQRIEGENSSIFKEKIEHTWFYSEIKKRIKDN